MISGPNFRIHNMKKITIEFASTAERDDWIKHKLYPVFDKPDDDVPGGHLLEGGGSAGVAGDTVVLYPDKHGKIPSIV